MDLTGKTSVAKSHLERFHRLNELLPRTDRFQSFPLSRPAHSNIRVTEATLLDLVTIAIEESSDEDGIAKWKETREEFVNEKGVPYKGLFVKSMLGSTLPATIVPMRDRIVGGANSTKKILRGTIILDGISVKASVLDLRTKSTKRPTRAVTKRTRPHIGGTRDNAINDRIKNNWQPDEFLALDLNVRFTVGAYSRNTKAEGLQGRSLAIKKNALNEPTRLYHEYINERKTDEIRLLEATPSSPMDGESITQYWTRFASRYHQLSTFYNSRAMLKRRWDHEKARKGEFDRATHALLRMVGGSIRERCPPNKAVLIGLGAGDFDSAKSSLHTVFEEYFVRKVRSLGYLVVWMDEYFTSQKCPCCHGFTEFINMRLKFCRTCGKMYHRDLMAAENMVNILYGETHGNGRPGYLKRPPKPKKGKKPPDGGGGGGDDGGNDGGGGDDGGSLKIKIKIPGNKPTDGGGETSESKKLTLLLPSLPNEPTDGGADQNKSKTFTLKLEFPTKNAR